MLNFLLVLILQVPDQKGKLPSWVLPYAIGGQAADAGTTLYGLNHNAQEQNPFLPHSSLPIAATKAASTIAEVYGIRKLEKNHPKLAKGLGIAVGSMGLIPALMNLYQINKK